MQKHLATVIFLAVSVAIPALAQAGQCSGRVVTRTGPTGVTLQLCLDGRYSTCMRDRQRMGYSKNEALDNCNEKRTRGVLR